MNVELLIVVNFDSFPNKTLSNFEQLQNAFAPIDLTEEGIEIDFNSLQDSNAELSIVANFDSFPNKTISNFGQ